MQILNIKECWPVKHFIKGSDTLIFSGNLEIQIGNFSAASKIRILSENFYYLCYILNQSRYGNFLWCSKEISSSLFQCLLNYQNKNEKCGNLDIFSNIYYSQTFFFFHLIVTEQYYFILYFSPGNLNSK